MFFVINSVFSDVSSSLLSTYFFSQIILDLFPYVRFELLRQKEEEEEENQQDISRSGVTRVLQPLHPNAIYYLE